MRGLTVLATGPLATFQDLGRPGYAHLGVPRSGAADRGALTQANRLVGNRASAVTVETTMGGWAARATGFVVITVTGPPTDVTIDDRRVGSHAVHGVRPGQTIAVAPPRHGCRNYVAVRGGFAAPRMLGSSSTDTLSEIGPPPLRIGDELVVDAAADDWPPITFAPGPPPSPRRHELDVRPGPRLADLADPTALGRLRWIVNPASNRIGVRLDPDGEHTLALRPGLDPQPSEGVPLGAVQVPPSGQPVLFLADHPVTGGYPVAAVLTAASLDRAAQLVAGDVVRLRLR
ncbi:biotin-dependent carboxyltransferase family protein [Gordonia alkaliphila]|uniref:5-oxoprolinase/urea amidolyase family protein n=1 Tax=Gordonia alkaliphila TaxID=1053547 RepID=A0ABP8YU16_9ACTN|nr:biotin-dependent carboxyltransferase family protein [Gordonia alkaliphila]MCK0439642.1 biotin-dependent carboxyltransferase family protein [Gordonia alkaliphila]